MSTKTFAITVSIYDAETQIWLTRHTTRITCRCSERAKIIAKEQAKHKVLEGYAKAQWERIYGITASQFDALYLANEIDPLKHFVFIVTKFSNVTP